MSETNAKAGAREWIGLTVLGLACLLLTMDIGVLFLAVRFMSAALKPSSTQLLWIVDIYGFVLAALLIIMGWLGDRIGRRRLLLIGAAVFGIASICAAYSTSPPMLIASRALLGAAAATQTPSTLALIRNMFHDDDQRRRAIGMWSGSLTTGAILGPLIGGLLLEHFWWGSVFLINVPVMLLLLVLGPFLLPEPSHRTTGRFDLLGAVLSLAAVLSMVYGIQDLSVNGYSTPSALSVVIGLALGVVFVQRQRTTKWPLIDLGLFRYRAYSAAVFVNMLVMAAFVGISLFTNQYLLGVLGLRPFTAALWTLSVVPAISLAIGLTTAFSGKVRPGSLIAIGLLVIAAGFIVLTQLRLNSHVLFLMGGVACLAAGLLITKTIIANIVVNAVPAERAGSSVALSEAASEFGGALGLALLGSIGTAIYHHRMAAVHPAGVPAAALKAARGSLGGAAGVSSQLPQPLGHTLLTAARVAFTSGVHVAAFTGAGVVAFFALLTFVMLRRVPAAAGKAAPQPEPDLALDPMHSA